MKRKIFSVNRTTTILIWLIIFILMVTRVYSDSKWWANPANQYLSAYKKYVDAQIPIKEDCIKHFVYFACDRESMRGHKFLSIARFNGAQIMYSWRQLEPYKSVYDFSIIESDLEYLLAHGKTLFIQLQDASFYAKNIPVPDYLLSVEYNGGAIYQRTETGEPEGWVAKRWNADVRARFALLLEELGRAFDGRIEGINLQESAIGVSHEYDNSFTPEVYVEALKLNMAALGRAFKESTTMQYANFMPGEWLPWEDHGYLRSIYEYGEQLGVGLGAPDLMVHRKGQLNHALAMMHEGTYTVPIGIAVQDGNYIGETGSDEVRIKHDNIVPMLHAFAADFLRVNYMFWSYQEPYFSKDVIPSFSRR